MLVAHQKKHKMSTTQGANTNKKARAYTAGAPADSNHRFGAFHVDDMTRARRFLMLGCEGGTYYTSEKKLGLENATSITRLLESGQGQDLVAEAVAVSIGGRAAKQSPTLFVLAMAARYGDDATRRLVFCSLPKVARTPTMLFEFIGYNQEVAGEGSGWGRGLRRAVSEIYNAKAPESLAHWVSKYRNREGWSHRDVLRLAHVKPSSDGHNLVLQYAVKDKIQPITEAATDELEATIKARRFLEAVETVRTATELEQDHVVELINTHRLAREHIPTTLLGSVAVWTALLEKMPMTAMLRNLAKMTSIGLLTPLSRAVDKVCENLTSPAGLRSARVHPFSVLVALKTYERGRGIKGSLTWDPVPKVVSALNKAFYMSFAHVEPTNKRFLVGMDVSGSMTCGNVNGAAGITPSVASAAMAMSLLKTESNVHTMAFTDTFVPLNIHANMSLEEVLRVTSHLPFGGTDCAQPMLWALKHKVEVDMFVVFTDCETWAGQVTPAQALKLYRQESGIPARLAVIAMTSGGFTIADPNDSGMLDMVGFDAAAPQILRDFALGTHELGVAMDKLN